MNAPFDPARSDEEAPQAPVGFVVDSEQKAEWVVEILLTQEDQVERRRAALAAAEKDLERARAYFVPLLDEWYDAHPPRKGKTLHLANGDVQRRTVPGGLRIEDKEKCIAWARKRLPEAVVPSFVEVLDADAARRGLDALYAAELAKAYESASADIDAEAALLLAEERARAAVAEAGAVMKSDEERTYVKAPRAPRGA